MKLDDGRILNWMNKTNFMKQSPLSEVNSGQLITKFTAFYYHVHNCSQMVPILSLVNPVHTLIF
jgi:hypothetical protein